MKTRKDLDGRSEDVETQRTCQGGLELFHLHSQQAQSRMRANKRDELNNNNKRSNKGDEALRLDNTTERKKKMKRM